MIENQSPINELSHVVLKAPLRLLTGLRSAVAISILFALGACAPKTPDYFKCNEKICLECEDCPPMDTAVLDESFRLQTIAYQCVADALEFDPSAEMNGPMINYHFSHRSKPVAGDNYGKVQGSDVYSPGFIGVTEENDTAVAKVDNVRLDVHEIGHAFTNLGLGRVPAWFNEGVSIFMGGNLRCDMKQFLSLSMQQASLDWKNVKAGLPLEYNNPLSDPHMKGAIFMAALIDEYDWNDFDIEELWKNLRQMHILGQKITTDVIKRTASEMEGKDLSYVFDLLGLSD